MRYFNLFFTVFISAVLTNGQNISVFSPACENEMMQIESCISQKITKENIDTICESSKSQQCQQFLNDPMSVLPSCVAFKELIMTSTTLYNNSLSLICEKSEDGNICPFTEYEISYGITNAAASNTAASNTNTVNQDAENAIKNSCRSTKCKEATQKYLQYLLDNSSTVVKTITTNYNFGNNVNAVNTEVTNQIKSLIDILNGEDCKNIVVNSAMAANDTQLNQLKATEASFATSSHFKPSLIISFIIYMIIYYITL
ncbi:hypothetical protein BCR32DRAFT_326243 [Anaeromyces robustus]|uniref:Uncharacterized protein n=1 Tax=Anaeromyces robustus TaxID=1754192 RepID=A0A1Y1XEE3_9FUNG|nr:hypothetical protein BCR32DRAFT_326243 [Anaeromyces robustus]|eukprot:ORX83816.1 hypothetical protein BCR32DRAFT_326243 [Anaeromyces robustus]